MPRRAIPRCRATLEEYLTCVPRNHFSMHPPCSSFAIDLEGEGGEGDLIVGGGFRVLVPTVGRRIYNDNGGNGPAASDPRPVGRWGDGSP